MEKKYKTLQEFYPYYLREHQNSICRALHFIGTSLVIVFLVAFIVTQKWKYLAYCPLAGYGFAWIGHAFFERNKPATFTYPRFSLASDFIMYWHTLTNQIGKKMEEAKNEA